MTGSGAAGGPSIAGRLDADLAAVPDTLVTRIRGSRSILAVSHENPDGDTLGAVLGIVAIAAALGAHATAVCSDPVPELYAFVRGIDAVRTDPEPGREYDLTVLCDCADASRVGAVRDRHPELFTEERTISIDHHASNAPRRSDWVDAAAAATCEMVALLALRLGVPLGAADGALADALMAGVVMDTATFQHPNATPRTLRVAGELLEAGAPLADISRRLYRTKPETQLRLFGRVLARIVATPDGRVVWSDLREADLTETGADPAMSEGIIDLLSHAEDAEVMLLFKERPAETRLSIRTKAGGVDATVLAAAFGGGGHARAAGATVALAVDDAIAPVVAAAVTLAARVTR
jgi:phosphoesterase RecJ-like protein